MNLQILDKYLLSKQYIILYYFFYIIGFIVLFGCGNSSKTIMNDSNARVTVLSIYNQAYQENFSTDSIDDIIANAEDAYVLIDTFNNDDVVENIGTIKSKNNQIAGYISTGTGENWRDDFSALEPYLTSTIWEEWEGEFFVSETTTGILSIMKERINKMDTWGLDWVEFDNMDWLDAKSRVKYGLTATVPEAKSYINALCDHTHVKGMKCMAKNTVDGFESFDGVLYESYADEKNWWDTAGTQSFLNAEKLVIINHYNESDCDGVYAYYKSFYGTDKISFICEDRNLKKYKHYNQN